MNQAATNLESGPAFNEESAADLGAIVASYSNDMDRVRDSGDVLLSGGLHYEPRILKIWGILAQLSEGNLSHHNASETIGELVIESAVEASKEFGL